MHAKPRKMDLPYSIHLEIQEKYSSAFVNMLLFYSTTLLSPTSTGVKLVITTGSRYLVDTLKS